MVLRILLICISFNCFANLGKILSVRKKIVLTLKVDDLYQPKTNYDDYLLYLDENLEEANLSDFQLKLWYFLGKIDAYMYLKKRTKNYLYSSRNAFALTAKSDYEYKASNKFLKLLGKRKIDLENKREESLDSELDTSLDDDFSDVDWDDGVDGSEIDDTSVDDIESLSRRKSKKKKFKKKKITRKLPKNFAIGYSYVSWQEKFNISNSSIQDLPVSLSFRAHSLGINYEYLPFKSFHLSSHVNVLFGKSDVGAGPGFSESDLSSFGAIVGSSIKYDMDEGSRNLGFGVDLLFRSGALDALLKAPNNFKSDRESFLGVTPYLEFENHISKISFFTRLGLVEGDISWQLGLNYYLF